MADEKTPEPAPQPKPKLIEAALALYPHCYEHQRRVLVGRQYGIAERSRLAWDEAVCAAEALL